MDPLEVANAFHREIDAAKVAKPLSTRVNRIKYPAKNNLGLGANVRKPTGVQVAKVLDTAVRKGLSLEGVSRSIAAGKKVETPAADAAKKGTDLFGPAKKKPTTVRRWT